MIISGKRRIPLVYNSQKGKEQQFFKYVPSSLRVIKLGCDCPPLISDTFVLGIGSGTNTLLYSQDGGMTWTGLGNTIFSTEARCAIWNNNMWVAGGTGTNAIAYSYDGIKWTGIGNPQTGPSSNFTDCTAIGYIGSSWIAMDGNGSCATSTDGINWTGYTSISNLGYRTASNGTIIVGIPNQTISSNLTYTTNISSLTWNTVSDTNINNEGISNFTDILWDGTRFIITIGSSTSQTHSKFYSTDGLTWTGIANVGYVNGTNIGKTPNNFYVSRGTTPNSTEISTNGINWTTVTNPSAPITNGIPGTIFGVDKNIFVCGVNDNTFIYSSDGVNWKSGSTGLSGNFKAGFIKH